MATNPAVTIKEREEIEMVKEIDMEMVQERYIDVISGEFAYDPVRLPVEQDPTQLLYNRKTLQTIWETEQHARNPLTRQWFDIKSAIPQTELRIEMKHFLELHRFPAKTVIPEYSKIVEHGEMEQHLMRLHKYVEGSTITENQWAKIWKKINLLRLFCEFHSQNIKLFISLQGVTYLRKVICKTLEEKDCQEAALEAGKEIVRAIDVILTGLTGLRARGENYKGFLDNYEENSPQEQGVIVREQGEILRLLIFVNSVYNNNEGYVKIQSLALRAFSTIFHEIDVSRPGLMITFVLKGYPCALKMLCQRNVMNISSEDLNHAVAILGRDTVPPIESRDFYHALGILGRIKRVSISQMYATAVGTAVIICISREIERSKPKPKPEMSGFTEGQLLEAEMQARHNCEALEKGIRLIRYIACTEEGKLATRILTEGLHIVEYLGRMFQGFSHTQNQNEEEDAVPLFICGNNCESTVQCVHYRVARDGLDISEAISTKLGTFLDVQILRKFIAHRTGSVHAAPSS